MAVTDLSETLYTGDPLPRRIPANEIGAPELVPFGEGLNNLQYFNALGTELGGKRIVIDTVTREFYSPLFEVGKGGLLVRFNDAPITIRGLETTLVGLRRATFTAITPDGVTNFAEIEKIIDNEHIRFEYHYPKIGLEKPVIAIAPLDRTITTIYVPQV